MKIILLEDVAKLGKAGDVAEVKPGYANNFLFKKSLAVPYTKANVNDVKIRQAAREARIAKEKAEAEALAAEINGKELPIYVKCGGAGKLYGSITSMDIAEILQKQGFNIDKKGINVGDSIKECGIYDAEIKLSHGVSTNVKLKVLPMLSE